MKNTKKAHTSGSPKGMGDYYGTGVKNPVSGVPKIKKSKKLLGKMGAKKVNLA